MKKTLLAILLAVALTVIPVGSALALPSQDVTITATPTYISISNSQGLYGFGVVAASDTPVTGGTAFTITNDGTVAVKIQVVCTDWSPTTGTGTWTYGTPVAENTAFLNASDGDETYDVYVDNTTPTDLIASIAADGGTADWGLQLNTPSSFTHGDKQQTTVTVSASQV